MKYLVLLVLAIAFVGCQETVIKPNTAGNLLFLNCDNQSKHFEIAVESITVKDSFLVFSLPVEKTMTVSKLAASNYGCTIVEMTKEELDKMEKEKAEQIKKAQEAQQKAQATPVAPAKKK